MKKLLNQKEQHIAYTRKEAEEIVEKAKENVGLTMNKINEKYNKHGQYFLIDLTYTFNTPKEVMESNPRKNDAPDGQMNMDEVDSENEKLPEFEDPFAEKKEVSDDELPY